MVEVDYDQLANFGGFDGHTPCPILYGIIPIPLGQAATDPPTSGRRAKDG